MSTSSRTDWIWLRHAPVHGQEARYHGQLDIAADPVHQAVAAAIARRLPPVAVWVASPLSRARWTALSLRDGVDPIAIPDFSEQNYGLWQGRSHNDVYAANRALDWNDTAAIRPPEGESFSDVALRVSSAVNRLTTHYSGHSIVAVAHASTIRASIGFALGLDAATAMRIDIAPLSLTRLACRITDGVPVWSVGCINTEFSVA